MLVHGVRPLVDGAEASASLLHRDFLKDSPREKTLAPPSRLDGIARTHLSARYVRAAVSIPAGAGWSHAQGAELYYEEEGA
jgi:hypothetical protein